jgi:hypothetical protein
LEFKGEDQQHTLSTLTFDGLDVVDVCPLGMQAAPEGAAALGRDGTLILFRDALRDSQPGTVRYETIRGTAYRLLCARGYLFLLTSEGLYVIAGLIDRFLSGGANNSVTPVLVVPMEAVDMNLIGDKWIWIVTPDGVLRFDIDTLERITPSNLAVGKLIKPSPISITPTWHRQTVEQSSRPVLTAV